jgi:GNAT superfamily N-acetyltransferase
MTSSPNKEFEQAILQNWARHYHCPVETLLHAGVTQLPAERYAGDRVIVLSHIAQHTFVEFDPAYSAVLERVVAKLPPGARLSASDLLARFGASAFEGQDVSLIHYLYPPDLPDYAPPAPFELRRLTQADAAAMQTLHEANTPEDVDDGYVEVSHEVVFGCFEGDRLAAAASGYRRASFVDIGVLTHPGLRRRGLGKAVVGVLCAWSIENGIIAQYRCNTINTGSLALAGSLHFGHYFHSEVLWLVP